MIVGVVPVLWPSAFFKLPWCGGRFGGGGCPPFYPPVLPGWGGGLGAFRMPKNPVGRAHPATRDPLPATPKPGGGGGGPRVFRGRGGGVWVGLRWRREYIDARAPGPRYAAVLSKGFLLSPGWRTTRRGGGGLGGKKAVFFFLSSFVKASTLRARAKSSRAKLAGHVLQSASMKAKIAVWLTSVELLFSGSDFRRRRHWL